MIHLVLALTMIQQGNKIDRPAPRDLYVLLPQSGRSSPADEGTQFPAKHLIEHQRKTRMSHRKAARPCLNCITIYGAESR